jgi:hypothetical protein
MVSAPAAIVIPGIMVIRASGLLLAFVVHSRRGGIRHATVQRAAVSKAQQGKDEQRTHAAASN